MSESDWVPNEKKLSIVLSILIAADSPLRFKELWFKCKDQMSRETMIRSLSNLEHQGYITKTSRGPKFVEYEANMEHPELEDIPMNLPFWRAFQKVLDLDLETVDWALKEAKTTRKKQKLIEKLAHSSAEQFTAAIVTATLEAAEEEADEFSIMTALLNESVEERRRMFSRVIFALFKADQEATRRGLGEWLTKARPRWRKSRTKATLDFDKLVRMPYRRTTLQLPGSRAAAKSGPTLS